MSALPPIATAKADIRNRSCPVCPHKRTCSVQLRMSALGHKRTFSHSFDYSVGGYEQTGRDGQTKSFRGFYVDGGFVFGGRLYRKVSGFVAAQDAVYIGPRQTKIFDLINSVGHQAPGLDQITARVDPRQPVTRCTRDEEIAFGGGGVFRRQNQTAIRYVREVDDCALDVGGSFNRIWHQLNRKRWSNGFGQPQEIVISRRLGVGYQSNAR